MVREGERDSVIPCFRGQIKIPCPWLGEGLTGHVEDGVEGEAGQIKAYRSALCTAVWLWEGPVLDDFKHGVYYLPVLLFLCILTALIFQMQEGQTKTLLLSYGSWDVLCYIVARTFMFAVPLRMAMLALQSVGPTLWSRPKYLNNNGIDCLEIPQRRNTKEFAPNLIHSPNEL